MSSLCLMLIKSSWLNSSLEVSFFNKTSGNKQDELVFGYREGY